MARKNPGSRGKAPVAPVAAMASPSPQVDAPAPAGVSWRREWAVVAAILLAGALLRGIYLIEITHEPEFTHPFMDPQYNDYWARAMVSGDWTPPDGYPDPLIQTTPHGRPPGYPYFLALVYTMSGSSYLAPRLVQMGLGLGNVVLLYLLARALFGRKTGYVAASFMAAYWAFIHFEGELTYPSVALFTLLLFMHAVRACVVRPGLVRALAAGLLLGVFALFRPNTMLYAPVLLLGMGAVLYRAGKVRALGPMAAVCVAGMLAALAPAFIRNYAVAGDFVFLSSYGGVNLWAGNNPDADGITPKIPHLKEIAGFEDWSTFHYPLIVRGVGRILGKENIKFSEASDYFYEQAVDFIVHHPLKTFELLVKKSLVFWGPVETTNDRVLHYTKRMSPTLRWMPGFPWVLGLFVMGCVALVWDWRKRAAAWTRDDGRVAFLLLTLLFIATYFASVVIYFVAGRYRLPVIPFLMLVGAYGVVRGVELFRSERRRDAMVLGLCFAGAFVAGSVNWARCAPDLAIYYQQKAKAYENSGDIDGAIAQLHEAVRVRPAYAEGHASLGRLLSKRGDVDAALAEYREALRLEPENEFALNNLADEMARQGKVDEALSMTEAAVRLNPQFPLALNNLGNLLLRLGRADEAVRRYEEALKLDPDDRHARYNLGNALAALGRDEEACAQYREALARNPRNPDIENNLGLALARLGKYEEALACYRRALALDAQYANAHNNIGYELARQGDDAGARRAYEQALALNPKLGMARVNMGDLLLRQGNKDDAERAYRAALECDARDGVASIKLGNVLFGQGRWEEAARAFEAGIENAPRNPDGPNNLANVLIKLGRFDDAIARYRQALEIDPRYANAHCNLGIVLAALGRKDEARQHLQKAVELDPQQDMARQQLEALEK